MISRELLSEVLEDDYKERLVDWYQIEDDNYLRSYYNCGTFDKQGRPTGLGLEINIYELQNKCRIWAYEQGYSFGTYLIDDKWYTVTEDNLFSNITYWHEDYSSIKLKLIDNYTSSTEPEAVFKCCQWILENKEV